MSNVSDIFRPMGNLRRGRAATESQPDGPVGPDGGGDDDDTADDAEATVADSQGQTVDVLVKVLDANANDAVTAIRDAGYTPAQRKRLAAAEAAGKNRKTVLAALSD